MKQPTIVVRVGGDPEQPSIGTLSFEDWSAKCSVGKNGLISASQKREGDLCTPIDIFPLRYGFYDAQKIGNEPAGFDFPFVKKPKNYSWVENPNSPYYNQMVFLDNNGLGDEDIKLKNHSHKTNENLFDLFIPIGWNDSITTKFKGSAIYIHQARENYSGTAGCIVLKREDLKTLASKIPPATVIDIDYADTLLDNNSDSKNSKITRAPIDKSSINNVIEQINYLKSYTYHSIQPGPRLLISGCVHGNEPCGMKAINRIIGEFEKDKLLLKKGSVTFLPVVNPLAQILNKREGQRNLNRNLYPVPIPSSFEDKVANVFCSLIENHDVLLDLHSFKSTKGEPFVFFGPQNNDDVIEPFSHQEKERNFAKDLGLPFGICGWLPTYHSLEQKKYKISNKNDLNQFPDLNFGVGSTEYMRFKGGYAVTVECGSHDDPKSIDVAYNTIINALTSLDLIDGSIPKNKQFKSYKMVDIVFAKDSEDFLNKDFNTGTILEKGTEIGRRKNGEKITIPEKGILVFPDKKVPKHHPLAFIAYPCSLF